MEEASLDLFMICTLPAGTEAGLLYVINGVIYLVRIGELLSFRDIFFLHIEMFKLA